MGPSPLFQSSVDRWGALAEARGLFETCPCAETARRYRELCEECVAEGIVDDMTWRQVNADTAPFFPLKD
jgi:hypothetical protein